MKNKLELNKRYFLIWDNDEIFEIYVVEISNKSYKLVWNNNKEHPLWVSKEKFHQDYTIADIRGIIV